MMAQTSRRSLLSSLAALPAVAAGAAPSLALGNDVALYAAIQRYREAVAVTERTENAAQAAYERYWDEFGGTPDLPEALYRTEHDVKEFCFYPVRNQDPETGRGHFPEMFVNYLRRVPCRRVITHERPVTIEDGFTEEEVASGNHFRVKHEHAPWPQAQARADEIVAAWDAYQAEERRRREASGYTAADEAHDAAMDAYCAARDAVVLTPATTMQGVIAKAAVVMGIYADAEAMEDFDDSLRRENETFDFRLSLSLARDLHNLTRRA
ncbi:hypothetical protein JNW90_30720 [Micromonospora sp. STR1s_5]|nr:hypothetical protein [Micromonospora sp. STR1s_5]